MTYVVMFKTRDKDLQAAARRHATETATGATEMRAHIEMAHAKREGQPLQLSPCGWCLLMQSSCAAPQAM